jgi:Fe-S oxidoreductase
MSLVSSLLLFLMAMAVVELERLEVAVGTERIGRKIWKIDKEDQLSWVVTSHHACHLKRLSLVQNRESCVIGISRIECEVVLAVHMGFA